MPSQLRRAIVVSAACLTATSCASPRSASIVSSPSGTVIVANMTDNTATVLDVASRRTLATLPTPPGPHEVAVSHDGRWAVVSGYGVRGAPGNTLTVVDLAAPAGPSVARTIDLGAYQRPHSMTFLPGDALLAVTSEVRRVVVLVDVARCGRSPSRRPSRGSRCRRAARRCGWGATRRRR